MRILPILWGAPPLSNDWKRLSAAREAIGYTETIQPAQALHGSPGRVLAIAADPDWTCHYFRVEGTEDDALADALRWCLDEGRTDIRTQTPEDLMLRWIPGAVYQGEEPYDG